MCLQKSLRNWALFSNDRLHKWFPNIRRQEDLGMNKNLQLFMNFLDDSFQLHYLLETEAGSGFVFFTVSQEDLVSREEHVKYVPPSLCTLQVAG